MINLARGGALACVLAGVVACSTAGRSSSEPVKASAQDLQLANYSGASLPAKTVALTFDDGPGSRTIELSAYLKSEGIQATFFQNGKCFTDGDHPCGNRVAAATLEAQLLADGHLIGNHTQDHLDLTSQFPAGAAGDQQIVDQVTETDDIISPYVDGNHFLFRAPYGFWNSRDFNALSPSAMNKYVGPINWDAGGAMDGDDVTGYAADWDCWQNQDGYGFKTSRQCGTRYVNEIKAVGHGVVLMHDGDKGDPASVINHDLDNGTGNTIDMVKSIVVPQLKAAGFTFVRADSVPSIANALGAPVCDASCATCNASGANHCLTCRAGSYLSGGTCKTCSTCAADSYQVSACTANADAVCSKCTTCGANQYQRTACTANADAVCAACDASCTSCTGPTAMDCSACPSTQYLKDETCHACTTCAAGTSQTSACSATADTACTACAAGTYASAGATSCTACGSCDDGDACTTDSCDAVKGCVHTTIAGCPAPDASAPPPAVDAGTEDASATPPDAGHHVTTEESPSVPGEAPADSESGCSMGTTRANGATWPWLFAIGALAMRQRRRSRVPSAR